MHEEAIKKANILIEALPYIRDFHHKIIVVKLGGSSQENDDVLLRLFEDLQFLISVGIYPVVVHGGGKFITKAMKKLGKPAQFIQGMRVTDSETMDIVESVLCDEVANHLSKLIEKVGGQAACLNGRDHKVLRAVKMILPNDPTADLGFVGDPIATDALLIRDALKAGKIPLIAPVAGGHPREHFQLYNINGDIAAALIARDLHAEKIVFFFDQNGVLRDRNDPNSLIKQISSAEIQTLIQQSIIDGGMLPKVQSALFALEGGVRTSVIVSGSLPHAILLEIFTNEGVGTMITL